MTDFGVYFKEIAETLKEITLSSNSNHFTKAESLAKMEGFLAEMQYAEGYQLVLLDSLRAQYVDRKSDNILLKRFVTFFVMKNVPEGTFSEKYKTITSCMGVCNKIIAKMLCDRQNYLDNMHRLDPASITFQQVGPVGSNWWGINVSFFVLDSPGIIVHDPRNWIPIS